MLGSHDGWICFDRANTDAAVGCGDDPRVLLLSCLEASPCWTGGGVYWPIYAAACSDIADLLLDFCPLFAAENRWTSLKFGFAGRPNRYPDARRSAVDHA
ncbi:hypothetical protein ACLOJK_038369 [Asimina triloba]